MMPMTWDELRQRYPLTDAEKQMTVAEIINGNAIVAAGHPVPPTETEQERRYSACQLEVLRLMGQESRLSNANWFSPGLQETAVVRFFKTQELYPVENYLVIGATGNGKTHGTLAFMVYQMCKRQKKGCFITAYDLALAIHRKDYDGLDILEAKPYLLIDDLGSEPQGFKGKDFLAHFENLFSTRHRYRRHTYITSNAKLEEIRQVYGERFISRFRESGRVFESTDADMRAAS